MLHQQSKFGEIAMFDPQELDDFKLGKTISRTTRIVPVIYQSKIGVDRGYRHSRLALRAKSVVV